MRKSPPGTATDLRGAAQLATDATAGLTDLVEAVHERVTRIPGWTPPALDGRARGITGLVYKSIRGVTRLAGGSLGALLGMLAAVLHPAVLTSDTADAAAPPREREAIVAALNGVLGDYLAATANPLAISMTFRHHGRPLPLHPQALGGALPHAGSNVLVLVHGLCMGDLQWLQDGHDHGAALARDEGFTPVYLHYNSGRHISTNGREFAGQMEALLHAWPRPVERLVLIGHSMGGLPFTAPFARLGKVRSAGITDLRHGYLVEEDWVGRDRFARVTDRRQHLPLPLPAGVRCFAAAATLGAQCGDLKDRLLGDGLVPLESALGHHRDPSRSLRFAPGRQWVGYGMGHLDLLKRPEVYAQIQTWLK